MSKAHPPQWAARNSPPPSYQESRRRGGPPMTLEEDLDLDSSFPPHMSPTSDKKPFADQKKQPPPNKKQPQTPPNDPPKKKTDIKRVLRWVKFAIYFVILVAVVGLCMISAVLSIKKLLETKDLPASTYTQKNHAGPHENPGLIFIAEQVVVRSSEEFNLTSLNIDELAKIDVMDQLNFFELHHTDPIDDELNNSLPQFLANIRREGSNPLSINLVKGPSDWGNKQSIIIHMTIPNTQAGVWGVIHPNYAEIYDLFLGVANNRGEPQQRWALVKSLLEDYSMNFISSNFRSFFLMSKQEFKNLGVLEAVRIDMEISLMESNFTALDEAAGQTGVPEEEKLSHVEAMYQWKDGYYMLGDSFMATTPWQIVTVISSALLMLERGYNTFMKVWASARAKPSAPKEPSPEEKGPAEAEIEDEEGAE